jgi:hypothetical protein
MDRRDLLTLESAVTAIEEAAAAVAREVERDRLRETSLARLSTVEAELNRSQLALEKIIQEPARTGEDNSGRDSVKHFSTLRPLGLGLSASQPGLANEGAEVLTSARQGAC